MNNGWKYTDYKDGTFVIDMSWMHLDRSTEMVYEILYMLQKKLSGHDVPTKDYYKLIDMGKQVIADHLKRAPSLREKFNKHALEMHIRNLQ